MSTAVLTQETSLRLYPIDAIVAFGVHGSTAFISASRSPEELNVTPGTLKVEDTYSDNFYRKTITAKVPETSPEVTAAVSYLGCVRVIAIYEDERGCERVVGSPSYPGFFSWTRKGGSLEICVKAVDKIPNCQARL